MTNKLRYFVANWKMFGDLSSIKILISINKFLIKTKRQNKKKIIACVPNTLIYQFSSILKKSQISVGAQNCHYKDSYGPYTGSISPSMIKKAGAEYIIIGHSENRKQGDTNKLIKEKIKLSLRQNLKIIFCIGESQKEKRNKRTLSVLKNQINKVLNQKINLNKIILAYEPIWSIGSGKIPKKKELEKTINFIKKYTKNKFKRSINFKVLYGGSVDSSNASNFSDINEIDGFLIGGASKSSKKFIDIIKNYYK